jgi:hypothetical protein
VFGFRKKVEPQRLPTNPGQGSGGVVSLRNSQKSWVEQFNLVSILSSVLVHEGHQPRAEKSWLVHKRSEYVLLPQIVDLQPLDKGGVKTTTTIQSMHPALISEGIFEYQHSTGDTVEESVRAGFTDWVNTDFAALLDALEAKPKICNSLMMELPGKQGNRAYSRRAVLGPPTHVTQHPLPNAQKPANERDWKLGDISAAHEFCPCCLLTNSFKAFRELCETNRFYGLRLFAMRDENGVPEADCRVNGDDWDRGAQALRAYAASWPPAGFEVRKQYIVLQSVSATT